MKKTKKNKHSIHIQFASKAKYIPSRFLFLKWANCGLQKLAESNALSIRVVDKKESHALNFQFRKKPKPTNVLAFPFETTAPIPLNYLGDIVICAPIVAQEARLQKKNLAAHFAHMVIHGILHLQGFDHIKQKDAVIMEQLEINLLQQLGFENPY